MGGVLRGFALPSTEEVQPPWDGRDWFGWYSHNITARQTI
jgi:hypothetical protein